MKWPKTDFPFFKAHPTLSYLDNAATTQKPYSVLKAEQDFYVHNNASIHRSSHGGAEQATQLYEEARIAVATFVQCRPSEIIFTAGATYGINLIASGWAAYKLKEGDEILLSLAEHHSNLIPWQEVARATGAIIKWIPVDERGVLRLDTLPMLITNKTKLVSVTHISNVTGAISDISRIIRYAKAVGARVLIDASQSAPHIPLNISAVGCDFLVFSSHKMVGPTGLGVLFIAQDIQDEVRPLIRGGGAVQSVTIEHTVLRKGVQKFEAGTPAAAQVAGLKAALQYMQRHDFSTLNFYESPLISAVIKGLSTYPTIRVLGDTDELKKNGHLVSFVIPHLHAHDVAAYLDRNNIAIRAGNHCAQPLHAALGITASVRLSVAGYTDSEDVNRFLSALDALMSL